MDIQSEILSLINIIDFSPLKSFVDLNDLRNISAIFGVAIAVYAATKKWGNKAVYFATIERTINRPTRISSVSITNLKDKPLIIYEIHVHFKKLKRHFCLQKFNPPLIIKGLEATAIEPTPYSKLDIEPNPLAEFNIALDLVLITESSAVKCKPAKSPETLTHYNFKKSKLIGVTRQIFNKKLYSKEAVYALIFIHNTEQKNKFPPG